MKVLVTGASGFIGSHLSQLLEKNGHLPIPFTGDLLDPQNVKQQLSGLEDIDAVVHLAGAAMGIELKALIDANVIATDNLLNHYPSSNPKLILASSAAVYGQPISEQSLETDPTQPNSPYGLSKLFAEELVKYHKSAKKFTAITLRFSPVYGPGNNKGVIYAFQKAIDEKGEITINGDGTQKRNYLHVDDACQAILKAISYPSSDVFNISSPAVVSVNDIVDKLRGNHVFEVKHQPIEPTKDLLLSVEKARKVLQFEAERRDLEI